MRRATARRRAGRVSRAAAPASGACAGTRLDTPTKATASADLAVIEWPFAMHADPFGVLCEAGVSQGPQHLPNAAHVFRELDAVPCVREEAMHEAVLLDQLLVGALVRIR